jgi:hypothetical protein
VICNVRRWRRAQQTRPQGDRRWRGYEVADDFTKDTGIGAHREARLPPAPATYRSRRHRTPHHRHRFQSDIQHTGGERESVQFHAGRNERPALSL